MAASDQPLNEIVTFTVTTPTSKEEWFNYIQMAIEDGRKALPRQHKIQRVAEVLRDKNQDCFEPTAVSIGPYHRNKTHLQRMEKLKAPILGQYVEALVSTKELLYHKVEKVAAEARECYAEDATQGMSDEEFTRMMFLDGCFFLQFIMCHGLDIQMMTTSERACVKRDLYLLENQLPFIVLKALSGSSDPVEMMVNFNGNWPHHRLKEEQSSGMTDFHCRLWCNPQREKDASNAERENEQSETQGKAEPIHLLQLLRQSLLNPEDLKLKGKQSGMNCGSSFGWPRGLRCSCIGRGSEEGGGFSGGFGFHTYRSATELKKVGIHFRKSQSHRFTDVGFRKNLGLLGVRGELTLPPMFVDDDTKSRLLNLVAYEMCADVREEADVSTYVCFLDDMIDSAEDVKELRSHGILVNYLGSDQEVADLFNKITDGMVTNAMTYDVVNRQIEKHYKNRLKIWFLERMYTHFKAPWSCLSFFAALIILLLTFIQAFYAIKQGKKD